VPSGLTRNISTVPTGALLTGPSAGTYQITFPNGGEFLIALLISDPSESTQSSTPTTGTLSGVTMLNAFSNMSIPAWAIHSSTNQYAAYVAVVTAASNGVMQIANAAANTAALLDVIIVPWPLSGD
jgi:hypothetical protein